MPIDNGIFGLQVTALLHDIGSRQVNADVVCQCQMACEILSWEFECARSPLSFWPCDCAAQSAKHAFHVPCRLYVN